MVKSKQHKLLKRKNNNDIKQAEIKKKKRKYDSLDVSDFLENEINSEESDASIESDVDEHVQEEQEQSDASAEEGVEATPELDFGEKARQDSDSEEEDIDEDEYIKHKQSLSKLKDIDPEFYKFLQDNDKKLLDFNVSDSEQDDDEDDEDDRPVADADGDDDDENVHKPPEELEVASDESDFEDDEKPTKDRVITLKLLKKWQSEIHTDKSSKTIKCLTKAFNAALLTASGQDENTAEYKVDGSAIFNGVIQLCVLELAPALRKFLKLQPGSKQPPHKCKKFVKVKTAVGGYLTDMLKLLGGVTSANIQCVLLKHLHSLSWIFVSYSKISKKSLKKLIHLWSNAEQDVRVLAFLCIVRLVTQQQTSLLEVSLRWMYMSYVQNCKFINPNNLAEVNFMRRSLAEMFCLDTGVSYNLIFLYIRQLAIHLRGAVVNKNRQNICNWQYMSCLRLWGHLLEISHRDTNMQQLLYPLIQIVLGTMNIMQSATYFPYRFHLAKLLIDLSRNADVFIPILPYLMEVMITFDFNKKHKKVTMKPMQFTCILRMSKSQMMENGFKDVTIDNLYSLLLEYLADISHTIAFPDVSLVCVVEIKEFLKKCTVANYCKRLKQLIEKIQQNIDFIEQERRKVSFSLSDVKQIDALEMTIKNKGTPLKAFYESWIKMHEQQKKKQITNNDAIADYALPTIKKLQKKPAKKSEGPVELFPSDSEDEEEQPQPAKEQEKPSKKKAKKPAKRQSLKYTSNLMDDEDQIEDIVQDIKKSDW